MNRPYGSSSAFPQPRSTDEDQDTRATPESLGWSLDSDHAKLYRLVMAGNQDYYLELLSEANISRETPAKVYLDKRYGEGPYGKKTQFCCWPGKCARKENSFSRPADLGRHYKIVHGPGSDKFSCPYTTCPTHRDEDPFTRKDHLRDHLRDYHSEDIGAAKGEKNARTKEEKRQLEKKQEKWIASRKINPSWWTCAKCLARQYVERDGWTCTSCNMPCEIQRKEARLSMSERQGNTTGQHQAQATTSTSSAIPGSTGEGVGTYTERCEVCYGSEWVDNGHGDWDACPNCNYHYKGFGGGFT
ncbi:hypothetical protein DL98DRAFT_267087 [Cadophora sp. DSE1049]|nr:hypothetical protein DL98DRAFT_267087 [Cadophora sp. DSE1049]